MSISEYSSIIWMLSILIFSIDIVIILGSSKIHSRLFVLLSFLTGIWTIFEGIFISTELNWLANLLPRFQHFLGIVISFGFLIFSAIYPKDKKIYLRTLLLPSFFITLFGYLIFFTDKIISGINYVGGINKWHWIIGSYYIFYSFVFILLWIISLFRLFKSFSSETGINRISIRNMFIALFLGILPPIIADLILPIFNIFDFHWLGPITSSIWIFIIAYSIIRYGQMNVKVVVAEVLAIGMSIIFFINIFVDVSFGVAEKIFTLGVFVALGIFLVKSIIRETKQKEELRILNSTLEQKVAEQTAEVRKAYNLEKKARRELERLNQTKDQFIMITQHHLRTPLTTIKWQIEAILNGENGEISEELRKAILTTESATEKLTKITNDFLNITALKTGSHILKIEKVDIIKIIENTLKDFEIEINNLELGVTILKNSEPWPSIKIDPEKIKEVFLIILDNAIRYNEKNGQIKIKKHISDDMLIIEISNSGIGISEHESQNIFSHMFWRSEKARKVYPIGMGIGLSVARAILKAHHGNIQVSPFKSDDKENWVKIKLSIPLDIDKKIEEEILRPKDLPIFTKG